jgi:hypothetical protein
MNQHFYDGFIKRAGESMQKEAGDAVSFFKQPLKKLIKGVGFGTGLNVGFGVLDAIGNTSQLINASTAGKQAINSLMAGQRSVSPASRFLH